MTQAAKQGLAAAPTNLVAASSWRCWIMNLLKVAIELHEEPRICIRDLARRTDLTRDSSTSQVSDLSQMRMTSCAHPAALPQCSTQSTGSIIFGQTCMNLGVSIQISACPTLSFRSEGSSVLEIFVRDLMECALGLMMSSTNDLSSC